MNFLLLFSEISENSVFYRSIVAFILSFGIAFILYKKIIYWNHIKKNIIGENIRNLNIFGEKKKKGTPTMGGIVMIFSTIISTILFSSLKNRYVLILIFTTIYMGCIGFIDDYLKIRYNNKEGISVISKLLGQIILGIFVGITMYFNEDVQYINIKKNNKEYYITTFPFISTKKNPNQFGYYSSIFEEYKKNNIIVFITFVIITIVFISNGANITDGIDGLTAGISLIIFITLSIISIITSSITYSYYFNFIYIPNIKETIIFSLSFLGSLISFFWYNTYPAKIFMGDCGSLTMGAVIATLTIINRKELTLPLLCVIFFIENISVIIQVLYFIYSKKKYGVGKRIFLMAPIHHHFQKLGYHENTIFNRFMIIQIMFSALVLILLIY
ncbi:phospho-N-acetylmuramoyl-pentapeptide-transferase [Blattabacterium cuenoti]|uniref:phospho-N-acetylmuramoyl-pentapeptide- transferase n=1 Tax=Blattabacterium cuenoti TaxID=1653831 RepID=UPI00163C8F74|nr:phospho-N-acetylmuramoyl-pentapeptide-transferase [Blattabacterium cuenoti]